MVRVGGGGDDVVMSLMVMDVMRQRWRRRRWWWWCDSDAGDGGSIGSSEGFGNKLVSGTYSGFLACCSTCHLRFMGPSSWSDDHTALFSYVPCQAALFWTHSPHMGLRGGSSLGSQPLTLSGCWLWGQFLGSSIEMLSYLWSSSAPYGLVSSGPRATLFTREAGTHPQ